MVEEKSHHRSIMKIIAEMVRQGEPEDNIIKTLRELGVGEDEARRLLLVAQAQTFEMLKTEISRIIESHVSEDKPVLRDFLKSQVSETAKQKMAVIQITPKREKMKKHGLFSRLFGFLKRKPKPKMLPVPVSMPKTGATIDELERKVRGDLRTAAPSAGKEKLSQEKEKELEKLRGKIKNMENWQKRYQNKLKALKKKTKPLTEKEVAKKVTLGKKIRTYNKKIKALKQKIPEKEAKKIEAVEKPEQKPIVAEEVSKELQTMKDLAQAARAITLASERIVRMSPKPEIVIKGDEKLLSIDEEIEQIKRLKKRLEIDFYKRRLPLKEFQSKTIEYQTKLYELEEKKRILEKSKRISRQGRRGKVPSRIEHILERKMGSRLTEAKLLEVENYAMELMRRYDIPEKEITKEIEKLDVNTMLASLEKLATITKLEREARQSLKASGGPQTIVIGGGFQPTQGQAERIEEIEKRLKIGKPKGKKGKQGKAAKVQEKGIAGTEKALQGTQAGGKEIKERVFLVPTPGQGQQQAAQSPGQGPVEREIKVIEPEIPEMHPEIKKAIEQYAQRETVRLGGRGPTKEYVKIPQEQKVRVLIEPEQTFSEGVIPAFPTTIDSRKREKVKTVVKEIQKYRIITDLDRAMQIIKEKGVIPFKELEKQAGIDKKRLKDLMKILEDQRLVKVEYPAFGDIKIVDKDYKPPKKEKKQKNKKK
ncbi:MAG: hypothetical protein JW772_00390 [Candidatus Diapherotrites archaeon]|nr:hypothetical protein [Candidatus Diapherotrites archaeon]